MRIAVDTGGTFTDVVLHDPARGALVTHKLLSTPDDPSRAVLDGIKALLGADADRASVIHGSTVATNALLEGKGGRAAFVTTEGFEDTLHIARQNRPQLYALAPARHEPPIPPERCFGVAERVAYDGSVIEPMDGQAPVGLVERLRGAGVEAVAVSLLHSYANPQHEAILGAALAKALPGVHVTLSHRLLPEFREYERGATCAVNAVVAPKMDAYLGRLEAEVGAQKLRIMASSGGSMTAADARRDPVHTVLSGPAGGVVGALAAGRRAEPEQRPQLVTFDMGGTSTDVALCDGDRTLTTQGAVGPLPVRVPLIDIHTVGAGGGSVAWVDAGGALRVGPQSAGAHPGPACYGLQEGSPWLPTVTDAHVVLGRLRPEHFLGGQMRLDVEAAHKAVSEVAGRLGLDVEQTALGILRVAEATMARAIKVISVQRGHDARHYTLVCFGGAGGLHACRLALELGMERVLVPRHPGLLSAVGMLFAHSVHNLSQGVMKRLGQGARPAIDAAIAQMQAQAAERLGAEGFGADRRTMTPSVDVRYVGQSHELNVPTDDIQAHFERLHQRLYGTTSPGRPIEVVTARLRAQGLVQPPTLPRLDRRVGAPPEGQAVEAVFGTQRRSAAEHKRADLQAGDVLQGPLILTEYSSTIVVPPDWTVTVGSLGDLMMVHGGTRD